MKDRVSVGVHGSEESRAAARWAAQEAVVRQVPLRVVHAVDWLLDPVVPGLDRQDAEQWADRALTETSEELHRRHPQLEITTRSLKGRPAAALAAEAADAGLLVLGSRGLGGLVGFIIGSVAMSTLVATDTPVVLVRVADDPNGPGTGSNAEVVVGVDIHETCDQVLDFAFEEAARRNCPLRAVHGWKTPSAYNYVPLFAFPWSTRTAARSVSSCGDLLKVYLRPDEDIGADFRELIMYQLIPHGSTEVYVHVANGIVYLRGSLPDPTLEDVVVRAAGTVPGVVDVKADFTAPMPA